MKKLLIGLLIFGSFSTLGNECIKTRAAFDIGSGTTKMKVAEVDICNQKIVKMLLQKNIPVGYKEHLQESNDNKLDNAIRIVGIKAIKDLKLMASQFSPDSFVGVATSAFRTANNGRKFAQQIELETGVTVKVISQDSEAKIGFAAATTIASKAIRNIIVWDIGGGSMQMSAYEGNNKFLIYEGQLASVTYKDYVMGQIQNKTTNDKSSPNPISKEDLLTASEYAEQATNVNALDRIKEKIKNGAEVLGIGGVHYYSVRKQVQTKTKTYTMEQIKSALDKRAGMTDVDIGGKYASTEISNLALVAGYMSGLGIKYVKTGKINLTDGLLIAPDFAKE